MGHPDAQLVHHIVHSVKLGPVHAVEPLKAQPVTRVVSSFGAGTCDHSHRDELLTQGDVGLWRVVLGPALHRTVMYG